MPDEPRLTYEELRDLARSPRVNEPLWFGWTRWTWMIVAWVGTIVAVTIALTLIVREIRHDAAVERRERQELCATLDQLSRAVSSDDTSLATVVLTFAARCERVSSN